MNTVYRIVWNHVLNVWQVASELTRAQGKTGGGAQCLPRRLLQIAAVPLITSLSNFGFAEPVSYALPTGGDVVAGQAAITEAGNTMDINQTSQRAAINWETFDIGAQAEVNFNQPDADSVTLNRVLADDSSQIFGNLNATGQVFITNPNGVYFSATANVNLGGLVATTHSISVQDFMAGNSTFERAGATGSVINDGAINVNLGGYVALLAPEVRNNGLVTANMGTVALASGEAITLDFASNSRLTGITASQSEIESLVENNHAVIAPGGLIIMSAAAADQLQGAVVNNNGELSASSLTQQGGRIFLAGDDISLTADSAIAAIGATGGGEVLVGGQWQGGGDMHQATTVTMASGASIDASATENGGGGTVVVWSDVNHEDSITRVHGSITARGGQAGGDGGRVETSGHTVDTDNITVDAGASAGQGGEWLIDPYDYTIDALAASSIVGTLDTGTDVTVTTTTDVSGYGSSGSGSDNGDITVSSSIITGAMSGDATLTLQAARHITLASGAVIDASQNGNTAALNVQFWADSDNSGDGINQISGASLNTNGGWLKFGNNESATINSQTFLVGGDVYFNGTSAQTITTGGGDIDIYGETIIGNTNGLSFNSAGGDIGFHGVLNSGNAYSYVDQTGDTAHDWNWARTDAINGTGGGAVIGDSYLVTITSRLENAIAGLTAGYNGAWIGAWRADPASSYAWTWVDGPEAGEQFFTQTGSSASGGGIVVSGYYANFGSGEPNGELSAGGESVGQFFGSGGQWNDLPITTNFSSSQVSDYAVLGYVRETNLAASPLTINAGGGAVTFDSAVGGSKELASLTITAGATNINGGAITTQGIQTFNSPVVLGADTTFNTTNSDIIFNSTMDADGLGTPWAATFNILADNDYYWVDWTSSDATNVYGSISVGGDVISVTYHNDQGFFGVQTSGGIDYWTGSPSPFTSTNVANGPSTTDIIQLENQGSQTLSFSESVENLAFALVSLNGNGYGFDQDFTIESYTGFNGAGAGYFGTGTLSRTVSGDQYQLLGTSGEPHGTIRFNNAFSTLTWESLSDETWNGFTVGVSGTSANAGSVQFNGVLGGNDGLGALNVNGALVATVDISDASSLAVTGNSSLGGNVTTTGDQTYNSALTLTNNVALTTTSDGSVQTVSTIDGAYNLSIDTNGTGDTTLGGALGGTTPLTGLTINTDEFNAGAITLAANQTIDITNSGASSITGVIAGSGVGLEKNGGGNLTLSGANTYTGDTTINDGILMLGAADVIPDASRLIINANGTFSLNSFDETVASIEGSGLIENGSIVRDGIVLWLDAGNGASYDGTGTTWYDLSGNGYDGTLYGSPTYNGSDRQFEFTDNSQYAQLGSLPADFLSSGDGTLDGVTVFTVADFGTANFWERIVDFGNGDPSDNIILSRHGNSDAVNFELYTPTDSQRIDENGLHVTIPNAGGVRSYAGLADGTNLQLYVDGVSELTTANTSLPTEVVRANNYIGRSNWAVDDTLRGTIGIVLVYDRALSSAEIQQNHAALIARTAATLTVGGNNLDTTFSGQIENGADTLNLVKNGNGALTLTGNNGYSGTTTINAGAIYVGDGGSSGTLGLGNIVNNGDLFFDRSDNFTVVGDISGSGDIEKFGDNELTLTGLTTYTGATTIADGKLILEQDTPSTSSSGFSGSGALAIQPASSSFSSTFATSGWNFGSDLTGLEIGSSGNTADINVNSAISFDGPFTVYGGTLTLSANVNTTDAATGDINLNATSLVQNAGVDVSTVGGDITYNISNAGWTAGNDYAVTIGSGGAAATVNAGGGDIEFNSDFDLVGVSGGTDRAMLFNGAAISTTGSGVISITGDATNNGNTGNTWGIAFFDTTLLSDSGSISLNGTGGFASGNSRGIAVDGQRLDVLSNSGAINLVDNQPDGLTGTYTGLYMRPNSVANINFGADGSTVVTSSSDITLSADRLAFDGNNGFGSEINTTGNVELEPVGSSFAAATTIDNVTFAGSPASLIIGRSTNTTDLTLNSAISLAGPISVYGGAIALNAQLQATDNTITLQGSGSVTDGASGYVSADNLLLLDGTINLDNASNAVDVVAASGIDSLDYTNSNALSIGSVNGTDGISATGEVSIATLTGDLSLEQNLSTASTSASAVILNADEDTAAGTASGGNLIINNNSTITLGAGGIATLYSGSVNASTGLTNLVGSGSGRFRYNSDESESNYSLALASGLNAVYREQPSVSGLVDQTITYGDTASLSLDGVNGDTQAQIYAGTPSLLVSASTSSSGNYVVGDHTVTVTGGSEQLGYASPPSAILTVAPLALMYTGSVSDHIYDGTATASVTHAATGIISGDDVGVSSTSNLFSDINVADNIAVNISGVNLSGVDSGNYSIATTATTTGNITPATVSLSASRVYDGTTDLSSAVNITTGVGSETLSYSGAMASDAHVATADNFISAIALNDAQDGSGGLAANYVLPELNSANAPVTILARALTASAAIDGTLSRDYNGTTSASGASVTGTVSGAISGDVISYDVTGLSLAYDSAHVLSASQIAASGSGGFTIVSSASGSVASDYSFSDASITAVSASITPQTLTADANLVGTFTRQYDGTTDVDEISIDASISGAIAGDDIAFDASGYSFAYDSPHVESANEINASGAGDFIISSSASGSMASDYSFSNPEIAPVSASITPAGLGVSLTNSGVSRSYNGGIDAPEDFIPTWSFTGLITGDTAANLASEEITYNSANVLAADTLTASGLTIDSITGGNGSRASDYVLLNNSASVAAAITPALVTVTGLQADDKTYDGTDLVSISDWGSVSTGVANETLNLSASSASFATANAGEDQTVTAVGYGLADGTDGGLADNYQLTSTSATTTASINPAALIISANNDARFVTQSENTDYAGVSFAGFIQGESATDLDGAINIVRTNNNVSNAGDYADVLFASGYSSNNYDIEYRPGDYSIVGSDQLLVRVDDVSSTYGDSTQYSIASVEYFDGSNVVRLDNGSVANASVILDTNNLVTVNDGAAGSASFILAPSDASFSSANLLGAGAYQLGVSGAVTGNSSNFNNTITVIGSHEVTARAISASAGAGISRAYDGTSAMNNISIELTGIENSDEVSVSGFGSFASRNVGSDLAYTVSGLTLNGADGANYYVATGDSFSGNNGEIIPVELLISGLNAQDRAYNGNTNATIDTSGILFDGVIDGDDVALATSSGVFDSRHVGDDIHVTLTNTYTGNDLANYTLIDQTDSSASIARLQSVTWIGGASGNWFDPANWAGGAIPDLSNVANVIIPEGVMVSFDTSAAVAPAEIGPVNIDSLGTAGGLTQSDGELNVGSGGVTLDSINQSGGRFTSAGNVELNNFTQSGGTTVGEQSFTVNGEFNQSGGSFSNNGDLSASSFVQTGGTTHTAGEFTVSGNFSQTGDGSVSVGGNASITDTEGGLLLGNLTVAGNSAITSTDGPINQTSGSALNLQGSTSLEASDNGAPADIVLDSELNNFVGPVSAIGRSINLVDGNGGLVLGNIDAAGALTVSSSDGAISQLQGSAIIARGTSSFNASANGDAADILLTSLDNDFIGEFSAVGANVLVTDGNGSLILGNITATGDLQATSVTGDIEQSTNSQIAVGGDAAFNAEVGIVSLNDSGNSFSGELDKNDTVPEEDAALVIPPAQEAPTALSNVQAPAPLIENNPVSVAFVGLGGTQTVSLGGADAATGLANVADSSASTSSTGVTSGLSLGGATNADTNAPGNALVRAENANTNAGVSVEVTTAPTPTKPGLVEVTVPTQSTTAGFSFELPSELLLLASGEDALSVSLEDGSPLPSWLKYDAVGNRFTAANVPANGLPVRVKVTGPKGYSLMVISMMDQA